MTKINDRRLIRFINFDQIKKMDRILARIWNSKQYGPYIFLAVALVTSYMTAISKTGTDFDAYLDAAIKLNLGVNIYNQAQPFWSMQYYYSVFFAWILSYICEYRICCQFIWLMLSYLMMYRTFCFILSFLKIGALDRKSQIYFHLVFYILFINMTIIHISRNQMTAFLLWSIFQSFHSIGKSHFFLAASWLGIGLNIKLLSLPSLLLFFRLKNWRFWIALVLVSIFFIVIPSLALGWQWNLDLHKLWWHVINPMNNEHIIDKENYGMISISNFVTTYLVDPGLIKEWISIDINRIYYVIQGLRLTIILPAFAIWCQKESEKRDLFLLFYLCLITPLLFPHQNKYALLFSFPMIAYILSHYIVQKQLITSFGFILFCLALLSYSPINGMDVIGLKWFLVFAHLKTFFFSQMILIFISLQIHFQTRQDQKNRKKSFHFGI